jgi:hypothetical protein
MIEDITHGSEAPEINGLMGIVLKVLAQAHDEVIHGPRGDDTGIAPADFEELLSGEWFSPVA